MSGLQESQATDLNFLCCEWKEYGALEWEAVHLTSWSMPLQSKRHLEITIQKCI